MKIKDLMSHPVYSIKDSDPIQSAAKLMASHNFGAVPVTSANGQVVGMITDRDIAVRAVAQNLEANTAAKRVMFTPVITISAEMDAHDAARMMADHKIRRLPVVDNDKKLVGICAIADMARVKIHVDEAGEALSHISEASSQPNAIH